MQKVIKNVKKKFPITNMYSEIFCHIPRSFFSKNMSFYLFLFNKNFTNADIRLSMNEIEYYSSSWIY